MHRPLIQSYYNELKPHSEEFAVDRLWLNILPWYFTKEEGFGIDLQPRP